MIHILKFDTNNEDDKAELEFALSGRKCARTLEDISERIISGLVNNTYIGLKSYSRHNEKSINDMTKEELIDAITEEFKIIVEENA